MANISREERLRREALAAEAGKTYEPEPDDTFVDDDEPEERQLEAFERPVQNVKPDTPTPDGKTKIRVLPKGDGKIATGKYDRQLNAFTYHKRGDHLFVHPSVAKVQEDNGFVEIVTDE